jgi:hypothetical protein
LSSAQFSAEDEEQAPIPIGGFLVVAVIWLIVLVGSSAFSFLQMRAVLNDEELVRNLERAEMDYITDFLKIADPVNGLFTLGGVVMVFSLFVWRKHARTLVVAFLAANILLGFVDYQWGHFLASSRAHRFADIDPASLVPMLVGRTTASLLFLVYFLTSKRVRATFK